MSLVQCQCAEGRSVCAMGVAVTMTPMTLTPYSLSPLDRTPSPPPYRCHLRETHIGPSTASLWPEHGLITASQWPCTLRSSPGERYSRTCSTGLPWPSTSGISRLQTQLIPSFSAKASRSSTTSHSTCSPGNVVHTLETWGHVERAEQPWHLAGFPQVTFEATLHQNSAIKKCRRTASEFRSRTHFNASSPSTSSNH